MGAGIQNLQLAFKQGVLSAEEIATALTTGQSGRQLQNAQNIAALELLPLQQQVAQGTLQSQAALQPAQSDLAAMQLQGQAAVAEQGLRTLPQQLQIQELRTQDDVNQLQGLLGSQPFASPENAQSFFASTHPGEKIPEDPKKLAAANIDTFKAIQKFRMDMSAIQKPRTEEVILQDPVTFDKKRYRLTLDAQGNVTSKTELGLVESGEKPLTENQAKTSQYASRMEEARGVIDALATGGYDPTTFSAAIGQKASKHGLAALAPEESQQYEAAKANWISAALRQESGATITPSEFRGADFQYFPQFGDKPGTVAQKARLRQLAEQNMQKISEVGRPPAQAATQPAAPAPVEEPLPLTIATPAAAPAQIPTVQTAAEARALPATVQFFKTPDGRTLKNPNFQTSK